MYSTKIATAIESYRMKRENELRTVLQKLPHPYTAVIDGYENHLVRWAMLNQLYRTALYAVRESHPDTAIHMLSEWLPMTAPRPAGNVSGDVPVIVDISGTIQLETGADMPTPAVSPAALGRGECPEGSAAVTAAIALLNELDSSEPIRQSLGLVVLLNRREIGEPASGWTTTAFPGTVYLDWYSKAEFLAKDLVHESTHAWLNDALDACAVDFSPDESYYSPWKERLRPAYGMLHSIAAFSKVTNFLTRLYGFSHDPAVKEYCKIRVQQEQGRLKEAQSSAYAVLALVDDEEIAAIVRSEYEEALDAQVGLQSPSRRNLGRQMQRGGE